MKQLHNVSSIKACIISPYTPPHVLNTPEPGVKFKISTMKIISIISRSSNESSTLFLAPLPTENINHNIINIIINYQLQSAVGDSGDQLTLLVEGGGQFDPPFSFLALEKIPRDKIFWEN